MRSLLVVFPIAESTTTGRSSGKLRMRSATSCIRSAEATDDPPNFITTVSSGSAPLEPSPSCASFFSTMVAPAARWHRTAAAALLVQHGAAGTATGTGARSFRCTSHFSPETAPSSPSRAGVRTAAAAAAMARGWRAGAGGGGGADTENGRRRRVRGDSSGRSRSLLAVQYIHFLQSWGAQPVEA